MNEWLMILILPLCVALFAIGGTGFKWARRFVMPVLLGALALLWCPWWACLGYTATLILALCLPYGSNTPYWGKALVFTLYGLTGLWFGWSWWVPVVPVGCMLLFIFSNFKLTASSFVWKICEGGMGFLLAAGYIGSIINPWR